MLTHLFTTPIWQKHTGLQAVQLDAICNHLLAQREQSAGEKRSNRGGWHSSGNLFGPEHRQFPALTNAVTNALFAYLGEAFGYRGEIQLGLTGWAVVNAPGDYNILHNHAANLLSGALYLRVPAAMTGGAIHFHDPRLNLNAHETEAMRRLGVVPPWHGSNVAIQPVAGEVIVFPSWLNHWVEPFQALDPNAQRIVVSFNATVT